MDIHLLIRKIKSIRVPSHFQQHAMAPIGFVFLDVRVKSKDSKERKNTYTHRGMAMRCLCIHHLMSNRNRTHKGLETWFNQYASMHDYD